jgi:hypothetical protein
VNVAHFLFVFSFSSGCCCFVFRSICCFRFVISLVWGARYTLGARYLSKHKVIVENTLVFRSLY